ncbi:MAG: hypothetical protein AB8G23_22750 [Myxococcota bacterium]
MRPLKLFTAFHSNLDFSALPDADRPTVIARCYWPLLRLPEEFGIPIGFEASSRTLEILQAEDPEFVKRFRGLAERGLIELIGSGRAQVVAPLAPVEINRQNLKLGKQGYQETMGFSPESYFVNEQTYSDGLVPLYRGIGAKHLVMEWNNPAAAQAKIRALRGQPARLFDSEGDGPMVLWNDSIVFQKLQRIAHGQIPPAELDTLLTRILRNPAAEALCFYGGDVEIFDYRPSRSLPNGSDIGAEMERLLETFRAYAQDPRFEFCLPRDVAEEGAVLPRVTLGSSRDPIPCKKQPRYNPTRWAVSGRDGFGMNTRCHGLLRTERAAKGIANSPTFAPLAEEALTELVDLWRSDFRTRATEEKVGEFESRMGLARAHAADRLATFTPGLADGENLILCNPGTAVWEGMPIEIPLRLPVGAYHGFSLRNLRGGALDADAFQVDVHGRHRDGSIRAATLVLTPHLEAGGVLSFRFVASGEALEVDQGDASPAEEENVFSTEQVEMRFLPHRGAAMESVRFPELGGAPVLGTIPHGTFDAIEYTPDFYSGHIVLGLENGQKHTDLKRASLRRVSASSGAVRTTLECAIETAFGPWRKQFRLYRNAPRFDVVHDLSFHEARIASLRLGLFSFLPQGWDRESLRFQTVNGGDQPETRSLTQGLELAQSRAVSSSVSATSCLGATEGWVSVADRHRGLLIQADRGEAAVAPMLDFAEVDDDFFLRLSHTAAETDETRATFMRGRRRFSFAVEGFAGSEVDASARARQRDQGLIYRTEAEVGISTGL